MKVVPSSFATICTKQCKAELIGFLLSLSIHHRGAKVYIMCDKETKENVDRMSYMPELELCWSVSLDKYSNYNRDEMTKLGIWSEFQMAKSYILDIALEECNDCMFLDSDTIITDVMNDVDDSKEIGVSPGFINEVTYRQVGYYNGGMLWTKNKEVPKLWRKYTETSRYFDQASIEDLVKHFTKGEEKQYFEFGEEYNVQSWRFIVGAEPTNVVVSHLKHDVSKQKILYKSKPIKFIHTHFHEDRFRPINTMFLNVLKQAKMFKELLCISRMVNKKWIIQIPKQPMVGIARHKNDSFREIPLLLRKFHEDIDIILDDKSMHCKLHPNIILYDRPTLEWVNQEVPSCSLMLLGNGDIEKEGTTLKEKIPHFNVVPWTFWPRRPMLVESILEKHGTLSYDDREVESIFIGNYENVVQQKYRVTNDDWDKFIEEFHNTAGHVHKFTHEEYIMKLRTSKYGLCLRGYGSKCHREVELMAVGTVPIVTPEVSIKSYMDPPKENVHYIQVNNASEIPEKLKLISKEKWCEMSNECKNWYMRNVHSKKMWNSMIQYIFNT